MGMKRIQVAGVPIDPVTFEEAVIQAEKFLHGRKQHFIVTPNPEMAVTAFSDTVFRKALNAADLAICDGFGIKLIAALMGQKIPEVVRGVDFSLALASICEQKKCSLYLLGGKRGVAEKTAEKLKTHFPGLKIAGAESGGRISYGWGGWDFDETVIDRIRKAEPDMLFVALGHGKQERWIYQFLRRMPSVKVAIGIGGAFDFISGKAKRAPWIVRTLHFEWLWRLILEPKRLFRIISAVVIFPLIAFALLLKRK